jgi:uncharacterized protein YjbJ (UPF0337 family)
LDATFSNGGQRMVNQSVLQGNWKQIRGKLKEKWGNLADDDVAVFNGNVDQLVGRIQQKTGESRLEVEQFLEQLSQSGESLAARAQESLQQAKGFVQDKAEQVRDSMSEGYAAAESFVQERPAQSIAFAFGCGVAVGVGIALLLRERPRPSAWSRGKETAEQIGKQIYESIAAAMPENLRR